MLQEVLSFSYPFFSYIIHYICYIHNCERLFLTFSKIVTDRNIVSYIIEDPDDNMILECAVTLKVDYIVYDDKHLIDVDRYNNIQIMSLSKFVEMII